MFAIFQSETVAKNVYRFYRAIMDAKTMIFELSKNCCGFCFSRTRGLIQGAV